MSSRTSSPAFPAAVAVLAIAGFAALGARAAPQDEPPAALPNGLMSFAHARVVSAPPGDATPEAAAESRSGFRAFIDPATGKLAPPTPAQAAALEAAERAARKQQTPAARRPKLVFGQHGGVGVVLDESQMNYYVVRQDAGGGIGTACVPGAEAAQSLLSTATPAIIEPAGQREQQ